MRGDILPRFDSKVTGSARFKGWRGSAYAYPRSFDRSPVSRAAIIDAECSVCLRDRLTVSFYHRIGKRDAAAYPIYPWQNLQPLPDLSRSEEVYRETDGRPGFKGSTPSRRKHSTTERPIALSANVLITPPCRNPLPLL